MSDEPEMEEQPRLDQESEPDEVPESVGESEQEEEGEAELETVLAVFMTANVPARVYLLPEGETVSFRFGADPGPRVDLIVEYGQLDRLGELLAEAIRIRDSDNPQASLSVRDGA